MSKILTPGGMANGMPVINLQAGVNFDEDLQQIFRHNPALAVTLQNLRDTQRLMQFLGLTNQNNEEQGPVQ